MTELFVPGSRPEMIGKAAASAAAAVCIDLEDAVAPDEKPAARAHAVRALTTLDFGGRTRLVRINAIDTPYAYRDLIDVVEAAGNRLEAVMLPKAAAARDVEFVDTLLGQIERAVGVTRPIAIEAQIESAAGFVNLREIASASARLTALIFGQGDYSASMQMPASSIGERDEHDDAYGGHRYHAVMHAIVACARANGLRCYDGPYAAYKDDAGLERACRTARALGFDGKQCIHPSQLAIVHRVFAPTANEITTAEAVIRAFDAAVAAGQGAAVHDGRMIDAASVRMARAILGRRSVRP
jgi:citrate lyase beta subunit